MTQNMPPSYEQGCPQQVYSQPMQNMPGYPHPGYHPPMGQQLHQGAPIMVSAPMVQPAPVFMNGQMGPNSIGTTCASCHARIQTRVQTRTSNKAHIWAFVLCILGCWPCCLIPYCMDSCADADHSCPSCNAYVGAYKA